MFFQQITSGQVDDRIASLYFCAMHRIVGHPPPRFIWYELCLICQVPQHFVSRRSQEPLSFSLSPSSLRLSIHYNIFNFCSCDISRRQLYMQGLRAKILPKAMICKIGVAIETPPSFSLFSPTALYSISSFRQRPCAILHDYRRSQGSNYGESMWAGLIPSDERIVSILSRGLHVTRILLTLTVRMQISRWYSDFQCIAWHVRSGFDRNVNSRLEKSGMASLGYYWEGKKTRVAVLVRPILF